MEYVVKKSNRKTVALQIKGGELIVRAPLRMSKSDIEKFVNEHHAWIEKHLAISKKREDEAKRVEALDEREIGELIARAKKIFPERVAYYADIIGVSYGKITVRRQKSRWGSCSSQGNLSFNLALLLAPEIVLDSVVVHELCHRKHMNHSNDFYGEMARVFPAYKECKKWLRENGSTLMRRAGQM